MILTAGKAFDHLAEFVDSGTCDEVVFYKRLFEACRLILRMGDYDNTDRYCLNTCNSCITLPPDVKAVRNAKVDCCESIVHSQWFQFLPGAGDAECWGCCDITHKGQNFVTFADLPCPMHLMAMSDACEDKGASIFVQGIDDCGSPVRSKESGVTRFGEKILVEDPAKKWITRSKYKSVSYVEKPKTDGVIRLYGYLSECEASDLGWDTNVYMIGYYLPWELTPCYTRISVGAGSGPKNITILVKRKAIELCHRDQIVPVQSLDALTEALLSLNARSSSKPAERREFKRMVKETLIEEKDDSHSDQAEIAVDMYNPEVIV